MRDARDKEDGDISLIETLGAETISGTSTTAAAESGVELLIFDCDGVLVDSEVIAHRVLERQLAEWLPGVDVVPLVANTAGMTTEAILEKVATATGRILPPDTPGTMEAAIDRALGEELLPIDGVPEAFDHIRLLKAVASNSSRERLRRSLARAGLTEWFDDRLFSADMVAEPKPAPDLYLLVASTLGVDPRRCLVVEDSVPGITAARLAGMTVIGFTGASHLPVNQAERLRVAGAAAVVDRMALLPGLIRDLIQPREA